MITYNRSAFGWRLIFRAHGSAVYRSVLPSMISVLAYFLYHKYNTEYAGFAADDVLHPYAIGVLVSSSTFLIIFKLSQSYNRYWEACSSTYQFMSKWLDATSHTCCYHMQCDHYNDIKPPSFYDYPELNHLNMTRDRERSHTHSIHDVDDEETKDDNNVGLRNRKQSQTQTSAPTENYPPMPSRKMFSARSLSGSIRSDASSGEYGRNAPKDLKGRSTEEKSKEYKARAVAKSINKTSSHRSLPRAESRRAWAKEYSKMSTFSESIRTLYNLDVSRDMMDSESDEIYEEGIFDEKSLEPIPLVGKPRMDGNWGEYYSKKKKKKLSTFMDPNDPNKIDSKGFASMQGGRTPPLFIQELAHLSSLMNAVALATLRNDKEESESPLSIYEPGSPWPEVDPNNEELLKQTGFKAFFTALKTFLGVGLSKEERSEHNAAQPLPVIGGVSDAEIHFLQLARGASAKTQLCFNWLTEFIIREHLAGTLGDVGPPIISRIVQFLGDGMIYYNHSRKIMFIPFPFNHAQLSVIFVLFIIIVVPFLMHQYTDEPAVGALLTFLTVLCLQGINEVARDLENPFRNFPNELPLVTFQAQYNEALITMYAGYHPDFFWNGDQVLRMTQSKSKKQGLSKPNGSKSLSGSNGSLQSIDSGFSFAGENTPPTSVNAPAPVTNSLGNDSTEVAFMKRELEMQAKLIEQLFAKVGSTGSSFDELLPRAGATGLHEKDGAPAKK
ncbi:unnamed protein product [Pseudo-nitzschia multistriata]|uniref:Uncharacterized protein n=1 Tax=Pseudo-nitzschia multistriata TaxID=183589 RepID=A0A448ZCC3_9STRA|nr:unnamed protein product [Pseudo-nitzschia multistriata]